MNIYKTFPSQSPFTNTVLVKSPSDLAQLEDGTIYYIDTFLDMGSQQIATPTGNGIAQLFAFSANIAGLFSTEDNYTMFTGGGQLFGNGMKFTASGANSKVFDLTAEGSFNAIEFTNCNWENCTSIGELSTYRQGLLENWAVFGCADGFTFSGTWGGGFRASLGIVRVFDTGDTGGKVFQAGTDLVFNSRFKSDGNIQVNGSSVAYSFTESNFTSDQDFQLTSGELSGSGTYVEGITVQNTKCLWSSVGIDTTYPGAKMVVTTEAVTTVGSQNVKYKIAGTFTYSDEIWIDTSVQNRMRWQSSFNGNLRCLGSLSLSCANNRQVAVWLRVFDNSDTIQYEKEFSITTNGAGRAENVAILDTVSIEENWYIELWCENQGGSNNITLLENSNFFLEQRKAV